LFCECETSSLTVRKEHRLRLSEKEAKLTTDCTKLHSEKLPNLYSTPDVIRVMKSRIVGYTGHVACVGKFRNVNKILVSKPEGKSSPERPRHR
jgi:hypothetical protein